jgi:hypothetical protein
MRGRFSRVLDKVQPTAATAEADKSDKPARWSVQPDKHG